MAIQQLISKFQSGGSLTPVEEKELLQTIEKELTELKAKDPEKYAELIEGLADLMEGLSQGFK